MHLFFSCLSISPPRIRKVLILCGFALLWMAALLTAQPVRAEGAGTAVDPFSALSDAYAVTSGRYYFDTGSGAFQADVDNSEGGGWVLILQYGHQGGTNPALSVLGAGADMPVTSAAALGTDESADTTKWGHAGNAAMSQFTGDIELRWYGETSNHARNIHFRSTVGDAYVRTGTGSFIGIESDFDVLSGHSANLPGAGGSVYFDRADLALTNFPYWTNGAYHWGVQGDGSRWEVDDFPGDASQDTIHRVWVRQANPLEVTNTNDSGEGSLRQAMTVTNGNTGLDAITFNIAGAGPHTITLGSALPTVADAGISIDGTTQSGATCGDLWNGIPHTLKVQIAASSGFNGLAVTGQSVAIKGLSITGAATGIVSEAAATAATVQCSYIGLAPDGSAAGNATGIVIRNADAVIGGLTAGQGNVIGSNTWGILTQSASNTSIRGNFIGTDPTGTATRPNTGAGIGNATGTSTINEIRNNLISGNTHGLIFQSDDTWTGVGAADGVIAGNFIGTNRTGNAPLPNTNYGIGFNITTISDFTIGGPSTGDRNVISGNGTNGIFLNGPSDITILNNYIGLGVDGVTALGNGVNGISANNVTTLAIGNGTAGGRNVIGDNVEDGIELSGTIDGVVIDGNTIGLGADGSTARGNGAGFNGSGIYFDAATSDGEIIRNNVISDNGAGVSSLNGSVTNVLFTGNYVGTDATGLLPRGNEFYAINPDIGADGWIFGTPASGNVVSATQNSGSAFEIYAGGHTYQNNLIGVGADGTTPLGNGGWGIRLDSTGSHVVGGTGANEGNIIAHTGPLYAGLLVQGGATAIVSGNTIRDGLGYAGVDLSSSGTTLTFHDNTITGEAGAGIQVNNGTQLTAYNNTITDNGESGVLVSGTTAKAALYANSISGNGDLGIEIGSLGVNANDSGDGDTGPNDLLNFPKINSFTANGSAAVGYEIDLDVPAGETYRVDFFLDNTSGDANGEGEIWLGALQPFSPGAGQSGTFSALSTVTSGDTITATTTRIQGGGYDITSEFAVNATATNPLAVTNTNDSGTGSLRAVIAHANANPADDVITFAIPGAGPHTISVTSALPQITDNGISIDGTTQSGTVCGDLWAGGGHDLRVRIDGPGGFGGLDIRGDDVAIKGLSVTGFDKGFYVFGANNTTIQCSYAGIAPDGSAAGATDGFDARAMVFDTVTNPTLGGLGGTDGNVIGASTGHGVVFSNNSTGISVRNNFIGTDPTGMAARANALDGLLFWGGNITVSEVSSNVISGNARDGIITFGGSSIGGVSGDMLVQGNYIGVDRTGNTALPNGNHGWHAHSGNFANGVTIGGSGAGQGNVIAGNGGAGFAAASDYDNVTFLGNHIGTGANGSADLGNGGDGIIMLKGNGIAIGNGTANGRNVIANNGGKGLVFQEGANLSIRGNYIGIAGDGATAAGNDGGGISLRTDPGFGGYSSAVIDGNVIASNGNTGIDITSQNGSTLGIASTITVTNNRVGVAADGTTARGNGGAGIKNTNTPGTILIGGSGNGNIIAHNGSDGIVLSVLATTNMAILANSIHSNTGLGIDFNNGAYNNDGDGVTANDGGDGDTGPNEMLNFPKINAFTAQGSLETAYNIDLDVPAGPTYRVDFYLDNTSGDANGEGQVWLGSVEPLSAGTNLSDDFTALAAVSVGDTITATTTRIQGGGYDITSEFAVNHTASTADPAQLATTKTVSVVDDGLLNGDDSVAIPGSTLRYVITIRNDGGGPADVDTTVIVDNIPENGALKIEDFEGMPGIGPLSVSQGSPSSGLTYAFGGLSSGFDDLEFSDDGGVSWTYTPTDTGDGTDPSVTHIRVNPKGAFSANGGIPPSINMRYEVILF